MNHTDIYRDQSSFSKVIINQMKNDSDIERCGESEEYINKDITEYLSSSQNIIMRTNYLLDKYFEKIKSSCSKKTLTPEDNVKYKYRPEALSLDEYNFPGLWYLILKINSCEDFSEFHDLPYVLVPDLSVINSCLVKEEFILEKPEL